MYTINRSHADRFSSITWACITHRPATIGVQVFAVHPTTSLDAPSSSLRNIKHKHAEQPAKKRATPYRFHVSPLLNLRGGKQIIFQNVTCKMFCAMLQSALCNLKC